MKVAIYSGAIPSTTFIENLICVLSGKGVSVYLFGIRKARVKYKNGNIFYFPTPNSSFRRMLFVFTQLILGLIFHSARIKRLYNHLDKDLCWRDKINWFSKTLPIINNLPDIFHVQWAKTAQDWLFLKEEFGVKLVLSLRGAHINYSPICHPELAETYRRTFPNYDAFHAVSKAIAKEAQKYGADPSKIKVIYSGVDLKSISRIKEGIQNETYRDDESISPPLNDLTDHPLNIISVGRIHWKKGYKYSIDACRKLKDYGIAFHYSIVAVGDSTEYLFQIHDLDLQDHVSIIPGLNHNDVMVHMSQSDLFLLPSLEEGVANVVLETMALGTPVISTDCGGMSEVIRDGENGLIIKPYSSEEIANKIIEISQGKLNLKMLSRQAEITVQNSFSNDLLARNFKEFYLNQIEKKN